MSDSSICQLTLVRLALIEGRRNVKRGWAIQVKKPSMGTDRNGFLPLCICTSFVPVSLSPPFSSQLKSVQSFLRRSGGPHKNKSPGGSL